MRKMFRSLWDDERGFIVSAELVLVATLLVIGMVVGLQTIRDTVTTEMADVASAIGALNQSYTYAGTTGHASSVAGSIFTDLTDFCDSTSSDPTSGGTQCVGMLITPSGEGTAS
jgi:Flp pilus assembly pilin Flp